MPTCPKGYFYSTSARACVKLPPTFGGEGPTIEVRPPFVMPISNEPDNSNGFLGTEDPIITLMKQLGLTNNQMYTVLNYIEWASYPVKPAEKWVKTAQKNAYKRFLTGVKAEKKINKKFSVRALINSVLVGLGQQPLPALMGAAARLGHMPETYPLGISGFFGGFMGALGLTKEQRQAQAAQRKLEAQQKQLANQNARQQAQEANKAKQAAAQQQRQAQAAQNKVSALAKRNEQQANQVAKKQQAQVQQDLRKADAEKRKVLAQIQSEIRQIDAAKKQNPNLPAEWVAYRACLEERLKDVARVCAKPGTSLQDVKKAAAKAKADAKKEATAATQAARKKAQEDKRKTQQQLKDSKKKKDQQTVAQISPALKQQLAALRNLASQAKSIKSLPKNKQRAAADALIRSSGELLGQNTAATMKGYGLGTMGDCLTMYIPGKGWEQVCNNKGYGPPVPNTYHLSGLRGSGMRGMGDVILDPITGMYVDSTTGLPVNDPNATTNFGVPPTMQLPTAPSLPMPKGGCEGRKASKPVCMFYTLAAESQRMLYDVVQQIISLQNEILMVLNEIRAGAPLDGGATGGGYCDQASGMWINADGTQGGYCSPTDQNYPPVYDQNYPPVYDQGYPTYDQYPPTNYPTPYPPTTAPVDYGGGGDFSMDPGMDAGYSDVQIPYGYNQPYTPYQQIPDTMQISPEAAGGDIFSDGGVDYIPGEIPLNQYSQNMMYPGMVPQMDFQNIPQGMEYGDEMFGADETGNVPQDISIYGAPSTEYQMAAPNLMAQNQILMMPGYIQQEADAPLYVQQQQLPYNQMDQVPQLDFASQAVLAAQKAQQGQSQYDQNSILAASFEGGDEDFF